MKGGEFIAVLILIGILLCVVYFLSYMGLLPQIANSVQDFAVWAGEKIHLDKIVKLISENFPFNI